MTPLASITNAYADLITGVFFIIVGILLRYAWPGGVHKKVARGELSEEEGRDRLRRLHPKTGYVSILMGICLTLMSLFQMGLFHGFEQVLGALMIAFSIGVIAFVVWQKRKASRSNEV